MEAGKVASEIHSSLDEADVQDQFISLSQRQNMGKVYSGWSDVLSSVIWTRQQLQVSSIISIACREAILQRHEKCCKNILKNAMTMRIENALSSRADQRVPRCLEARKKIPHQCVSAGLPRRRLMWWIKRQYQGICSPASDDQPSSIARMPCLPSIEPPSFIVDEMRNACAKIVGLPLFFPFCSARRLHQKSEVPLDRSRVGFG